MSLTYRILITNYIYVRHMTSWCTSDVVLHASTTECSKSPIFYDRGIIVKLYICLSELFID